MTEKKDSSSLRHRALFVGIAVLLVCMLVSMSGCGTSANANGSKEPQANSTEKVTMVWLPDNSAADLSTSREAISSAITEACGLDVELITTTDYNVAIESIASGSANMALLGAEGYVQANKKNNAVQAAFTNSDEEGKLDGACYYSRICVATENVDEYKEGDGYSLENIKGKTFSFVSATSTSGFKIPSKAIMDEFDLNSSDELLEANAFFSEVLFGNSHAGSALNLLSGDSEAAAFDDVDVDMYLELISGEANSIGAVYQVRDDAEAPLDTVQGKQFTIIDITPVLNAPICFNEDAISDEVRTQIIDYFCSTSVADDPAIFVDPNDESVKGIFKKSSEETCFVGVTDSWYEPIRKLGA